MRHIASFIVNGTFEKFPGLKVVVKEYGTAWLPYLMWRLDKNYKRLQLESPWVKKWPSEYILENVKVSTQPLEAADDPRDVIDVLTSVDGLDRVLCFSTDYPHITFDDPNYIARKLPKAWVRNVMCDNACQAYGWTSPAEEVTFKRTALAGVEA
jgi:predicted TIM-barrel fold metal-dependent hydrolase